MTQKRDFENEVLELKKKLSFVSGFEDSNNKLKVENKKLKSESYSA